MNKGRGIKSHKKAPHLNTGPKDAHAKAACAKSAQLKLAHVMSAWPKSAWPKVAYAKVQVQKEICRIWPNLPPKLTQSLLV